METTTPFDLNHSIQHWRDHLALSPAFRPENLVELESHLRDSIARLHTSGLTAEEAFMIATKRIGNGRSLETEFAKVNPRALWVDRILWMLIGIQVWGLVSGLVVSISTGALSLGLVGGHFDFAAHGRTLPVLLFALVRLLAIAGSLAICWWLIVRKGQNLSSRIEWFLHRRMTLAVICVVLCLISLASSALGYSSGLLLMKVADMRTFGEVAVSMHYSNLFGWTIQVVTFIALTLILARKRIRAVNA